MPYDPDQHDRQSIRLPDWDYRTPAAYFVTICIQRRVCLFGEVNEGRMLLNDYGRIVAEEWQRTERVRANVVLDAYVVMPNHVHGIIGITVDPDGGDVERRNTNVPTDGGDATRCGGTAGHESGTSTDETDPTRRRGTARRAPTGTNRQFGRPRSGSLSTIVGAFKSAVTRRINRQRGTPGEPVWQRNFYERVVRNRGELDRIRRYIRRNPARWHRDRHHPGA